MSFFSFEPKTEKELIDLLIEGEGDFETLEAKERTSSKGSPMIELKLKVFDSTGKHKIISDYLVLTNVNMCQKKIRDYCYAAGLNKQYEEGKLSANDCMGKSGKCTIAVQEDETGAYQPKNVIKSYLSKTKEESKTEFKDSDIPW